MKKYFSLLFAVVCFTASAQIKTITPGSAAPDFKLKNVDNREISFESFPNAKGYILVFTCNTCPYAKAYEQRIIELNNKYSSSGFPVIAINPNDPDISKGDSFDKMKELSKSRNYSFPYLYDNGQAVTNLYGARNTPHIFIVSKGNNGYVVQYTGAIDNDPENSNPQKTKYVEQVITDLSNNSKPSVTVTKAIGCGVKRKS